MKNPSSTPIPLPAPQNHNQNQQNQNAAKKLKQVVFIFDATAMMAPFSQIINQTYLAPLFRSFSNDNKQAPFIHEYAIVLFRDHPPYSDYLVQCSSFTKDQFVTWCTSVKFGTGGYSSNAVCEGLCAATRLALAKKADERVFILFTNSSPSILSLLTPADILPCRCCDNGDCMSHAKRIGAEHIMLSIIAPRQIEALKEIFTTSKPTTTSHSSEPEGVQTMGDKSYLTLLRGLILPANPQASISTLQPHPANPPTAPTPVNPTTISAVPTSINPSSIPNSGAKTFWQGSLAWSTGQAGKAAPMLPLMAQAPPGADLSLYTAHEWPVVLHVSGVCSLSEPGIANHSKTAPYADFAQLPQSKLTSQEQASFSTFIRQLQINNWGAAVELPNRTMLIKPNTTNKGTLRAMIIPKLALKTQRPAAPQPTQQVIAGQSQGPVQQVQGQPQPTNTPLPLQQSQVPPQPILSPQVPSSTPFVVASPSPNAPVQAQTQAQASPFVPQSFVQQLSPLPPPVQTIPNFSPSPSPTMVTPSPPTSVSTPPTPPLSSSNQYIGASRSGQSVPIANVTQNNLFSPAAATAGGGSSGGAAVNARSPMMTATTAAAAIMRSQSQPQGLVGASPLDAGQGQGQMMETPLDTQLQAQPNQQPQLQQIQQQLHQHIQQAHMQYQQPQLQHQQQLAQQLQQQLHQQQQQHIQQQLHSPFQPPAAELANTPELGDEDDVVLLEVQPAASKKLKPSTQRAR